MIRKEVQELIKQAEAQGWVVQQSSGGHLKWLSPMGGFVFSSSTASDYRAVKNITRDLKAYGFIVIEKKKGRRS
jgi:predicted RNA binding protein YcfA (HicA-like mRNA interferase family)